MTLKQLQAFYWAATCHSFAMAAERVHLSLSSLSKRITELELSLGQPLFDRRGHRATLTDAGLRLLPQARALLEQAERLRQDLSGSGGLGGPCRIGVGELTALTWLPRLVSALQDAHPKLELSIQVDIGELLTERLERGELDVAVIAGRSRRGSLQCTPLAQARMAWCARPDIAAGLRMMDARALQSQTLVSLPPGSGVTHLIDEWLRQAQAQVHRRLVCNHWGAIVGVLVHSGGIGLLPMAWAQALSARGLLVELRSEWPLGGLDYALHSRRDDLRPLVPAVRQLASEVADFSVTSSMT